MFDPCDAPDGPTRHLGQAFAIASRIVALPAHLHETAIRSACGDDRALQQEVRNAMRVQPPPTPAILPPGPKSDDPDHFGRYQLHELIGKGSMGVVYRATQIDTGRVVALKRLRPGDASDALLLRFRREVVLLARLQHRGIVQILDAGHVLTQNGREPYLAMELVEGPGLLDGAREAKLDHRDRVRLLVQLCRALGHAHRRGVIHRDLKPDNVRLEAEGDALAPRVLDFGVATASAAHTEEATQARHVVGTLGYIAPEQIDGEVDVRCDVYSLGAIGYELLTGHRPVDVHGLGVLRAIAKIRDDDPPPASRYEPRLRGDLDAVLGKALARRPDDRYTSADEFGNDLERWLHDRPVEARQPTAWYVLSRFVRRQRAMSLLGALLVVTAGLGTYFSLFAAAQARAANGDLITVLEAAAAELTAEAGGRQRPRELPTHLQDAVADLVARFPEDPGVRNVQASFLQVAGHFARAQAQMQRALLLRRELLEVRRWLAATVPSPETARNVAIALVLVGDVHKEIAENRQADFRHARQCYLEAHPLFLRACANAPNDRRANDDLAHSFLRLAALDLKERQLNTAESLLAQAEVLVKHLTSEFSDSPHTHEVLRELLGLSGVLSGFRGEGSPHTETTDRMLEHILTVHRLDPDNLHATEFLLATARSCAQCSYDAGLVDKAREQLRIADGAAAVFAARDPGNVQALEERALTDRLWARLALDAGNPAAALRHIATATQLALAMRGADDPTRMFARLLEVAAVGQVALHDLDGQAEALREDGLAAARLLMPWMSEAATIFPQCRELQDCCARLQAHVRR